MVAKLTIIFLILVCLMVGTILVLLPWTNLGVAGDWSNNYFLTYIVSKTGFENLTNIVASGWFRGAITGLGVFNLFLAFWEIANFQKSVSSLEGRELKAEK